MVESVVFAHELNNTIQMNTLGRVAGAMGCNVVYGIVPKRGLTMDALAVEQQVKRVLKSRDQEESDQVTEGTIDPARKYC